MPDKLSDATLERLFVNARTHNAWSDKPVDDQQIRDLYELAKWGPTSANSSPARFVWVRSEVAKTQLAALSSGANPAKILAAPLTVIVGYDLDFPDTMPALFPDRGEMLSSYFKNDIALTESTGFRNSSLQGAYLMLAARALGMDCGPMSGFNNADVDKLFFADTRIKSNFICSIGYGNASGLFPRNPRLSFEEAGRFV